MTAAVGALVGEEIAVPDTGSTRTDLLVLMPVYAFAIEHPEGVIVIDTGETARASQPGYFPALAPRRARPGVRGSPRRAEARTADPREVAA